MELSAGTRLGPYEILAPLGAGGMGEVYRATDTKLGRDVAIKVLPSEMAGDAERLARFQREAHLLASLNHPHIAAIHGLEEADGQRFLVLELVEGEDLKERLERGAIPVDEALEIAEQVAEALEEAHSKGIVHRDLKPANVKVTPDGKVKVLDFGLAKAWAGDAAEGSASSASMSRSPTLAHSGTQAGVILGTAAYMSPEQARGKPVDRRGDVWAFGVLLWEMLTGRALFAGDTVTDVIAAVVTKDPDLDALPAGTPRAVRWLLARCLRKDPRTRLPDIGAARLALQDVLAGTAPEAEAQTSEAGETGRAPRQRRVRERWAWAVALLAAGAAAVLALAHLTEVPEPKRAAYFAVDPPEGWAFMGSSWPVPSPDGRHVVSGARPDGPGGWDRRTLWLRLLGSLAAQPLAGTEGSNDAFWSPDSRSVGFFALAEGELRKVSLADGVVQMICTTPAPLPGGADWNEEGTILFGAFDAPSAGAETGGLYSVAAAGGEARPVLMPDVAGGEVLLAHPRFLPDGRRFLFTAFGKGWDPLGSFVGSLDRPGERRLLVPGIAHLELAPGHVLFNRGGTLLAQPFDSERAALSGEVVTITSSLAFDETLHGGYFGPAPGDTLAYLSGEGRRPQQLTWLNRKGERLGTVGEPGIYGQIALSPDERRVAVEVRDPKWEVDLWVLDVARGIPSRLTSEPGDEVDPVWSPDSQEVAYGSSGGAGEHLLFRKGLRGQPASPVPGARGTDDASRDRPEDWSSDGKVLLCKKLNGTTVWALPLDGGGDPEPVLELGFRVDEPHISPDGRWLAYTAEESGAWEVYVQPFRREGERVRVSVDGGGQPQWRRDGRELFFVAPDGQLMAASVGEGPGGPEVGLPSALFSTFRPSPTTNHYGVSADGQRFLVMRPAGEASRLQMHVILNWTSLLERR